MKKIMIVTAAVAIAAVAQAGIVVNTNCNPRVGVCDDIVFKVTANGKVAAVKDSKKYGSYLTASKLKVKKGALVLFNTSNGSGCCYGAYSLYAEAKVNGETYPVGVFGEALDSWSIFGKGYNQALMAEKSKKYKVESELGISYENSTGSTDWTLDGLQGSPSLGLWNTDELEDTHPLSPNNGAARFAFMATAFGKGTYAFDKGKSTNNCGVCIPGANTYEFTPSCYNGWFAGFVTNMDGDFGCLLCECAFIDVFGGTWKAKYDKSMTGKNGWESAARWVFGAAVLADMKVEGIE